MKYGNLTFLLGVSPLTSPVYIINGLIYVSYIHTHQMVIFASTLKLQVIRLEERLLHLPIILLTMILCPKILYCLLSV